MNFEVIFEYFRIIFDEGGGEVVLVVEFTLSRPVEVHISSVLQLRVNLELVLRAAL